MTHTLFFFCALNECANRAFSSPMASRRETMEYRERFRDFWQYVSGDSDDKAVKTALYTVVAQVFVVIVCIALVALFYTMELFVRPLLWAVLCGCALHPLKYECSKLVRNWLASGRESSAGLTCQFILLPFQLLRRCLNVLDSFLSNYWKMVLGTFLLLGVALLCEVRRDAFAVSAVTLNAWAWEIAVTFYEATEKLRIVHILSVLLAWCLLLVFWWTPRSSGLLRFMSFPLWLVASVWASTLIPSVHWRLPVALAFPIAVFVAQVWPKETQNDDNKPDGSRRKDPILKKDKSRPRLRLRRRISVRFSAYLYGDSDEPDGKGNVSSWPFFVALFWAVCVVKMWQDVWLLFVFAPACILLVLVYRFLHRFGARELIKTWMTSLAARIRLLVGDRTFALFPTPIRRLFHVLRRMETQVCLWLEAAVDSLTSVFVIGSLIVGIIIFSILMGIQTQGEAVHIVTVTNDLWKYTMNQSPEINKWINSELNTTGMRSAIDSAIERGFEYGRDWIKAEINRTFFGEQDLNTSQLEEQLLTGYDQIYHMWLRKEQDTSRQQHFEGITSLYSQFSSFSFTNLSSVVMKNLGALSSVVQSLGSFLSKNLNLMFSFVTAILSLIFRSGSAVLNLTVSLIVFFSTLFYLLAMSGDEYSALTYLVALVPVESEDSEMRASLRNTMSEAIRSVFGASLKMALFYGLFTWLTFTLFGMNVVIIPAAIAALFGAIPFIGTYWVAVPGSFVLWLADDEIKAIALIIIHVLPMSFVDTAIYGEIEGGGHPYVTGLAVAGGIYWFGLEGAIIGPLLLCGILVAIDMYRRIARSRESTASRERKSRSPLMRSLSQENPIDWPDSN